MSLAVVTPTYWPEVRRGAERLAHDLAAGLDGATVVTTHRARAAGVAYAGAPEVLTYHAVDRGLVSRLRGTWRWQHMALLVRRHPELRRELPLGGWAWKAEHARLLLAVAGLVLRRPWLALPYVLSTPRTYGSHPRALARTAIELPGRAVIDTVETAALIRGSVRHRAPLL